MLSVKRDVVGLSAIVDVVDVEGESVGGGWSVVGEGREDERRGTSSSMEDGIEGVAEMGGRGGDLEVDGWSGWLEGVVGDAGVEAVEAALNQDFFRPCCLRPVTIERDGEGEVEVTTLVDADGDVDVASAMVIGPDCAVSSAAGAGTGVEAPAEDDAGGWELDLRSLLLERDMEPNHEAIGFEAGGAPSLAVAAVAGGSVGS
jgi:hypothetical protein